MSHLRERISAPSWLGRRPASTAGFPGLGGREVRRSTEPVAYQQTWRFDTRGDRPGQLKDPTDICFKSDGKEIVVSDRKNNSVQVYTPSREEVRLISRIHTPCVSRPTTVDVTPNGTTIVIADRDRVHFVDDHGDCSRCWRAEGEEKTSLFGVCLDPDQNLVLSDLTLKPTVEMYSPEGVKIRSLHADFIKPNYVACSDTLTYVSDCEAGAVYGFDKRSKKAVCTLGRPAGRGGAGRRGSGAGQALLYPMGLSVDYDGRVHVADRGQTAVSMFSADGQFLCDLLTEEDGLRDVVSVAVSTAGTDPEGSIAVTEKVLHHGGRDSVAVSLYRRERHRTAAAGRRQTVST